MRVNHELAGTSLKWFLHVFDVFDVFALCPPKGLCQVMHAATYRDLYLIHTFIPMSFVYERKLLDNNIGDLL